MTGHKNFANKGAYSISVLIPTHNRWHTLSRALNSVKKQTFQASEILVLDDGSYHPANNSIKKDFPDVLFLRQENKGVASARNLGIQNACCNWIALLDSDDEWEPSKLEKQIAFIQKFPDFRAVHTAEKWLRNGNEVTPPNYLDKSSYLLWERSLMHCLICPSSVMIHRSIFETIGLFDEELTVCEDYDFWLRLLLQQDIGLVNEKLVIKHGGHPDQLSTKTWGKDRFRLMALQKILSNPLLSNDRRIKVIEVLHEKCGILAQGSEKRGKFDEAKKYKKLANEYCYQFNPQNTSSGS